MNSGTSKIIENDVKKKLEDLFAKENISVLSKFARPDLWSKFDNEASYLPVYFSTSFNEYQLCYHGPFGSNWIDLSIMLIWDSNVIAYWPFSFNNNGNGEAVVSTFGLELLPPFFTSEVPCKLRKKVAKSCLSVLMQLSAYLNVQEINVTEIFTNTQGFSEWSQLVMLAGAARTVRDELYLNLSQSMEEIRQNFSKSLKWRINSGRKLWQCKVLENREDNTWNEFRELHKTVSGRVTRSIDSWNKQYENLLKGNAFLVYLKNENDSMVGGGFFDLTKDEALYSVAAYRRELFDKPLGHVVQFFAIEEMIKRRLKWYNLGARPYSSEMPKSSQKELSIADFKQSFASHVFPKYSLNLKINKNV